MSFEKELNVVIRAALEAAKLCEQIRSGIPESIEKNDRSPVTVRSTIENNSKPFLSLICSVGRFRFSSDYLSSNS